jgi:hypothetical protein
MNLNISEHIEYNQYKEKLNEIYDKLDEVIYLSNTIDYKKITILLAEIVQNFDYYKYHKEALATEAATAAAVEEQPQPNATVGGGNGDSGGKEPEQPKKPHSLIDDNTISNIKDGEEYKRLRSYIEKTKTRIDKKGDKLLELVKTFLEIYFKQLDNNKMNDDFIKQENNLDFKLNDIIANIDRIEHGIHDESKEEAKIYVDLMSNQWRFQWLHNTAETNLDEFVGMWYQCYKKPFVKNIHVIDKAFNSITKEDYKVFVNKLYKDLFVKLHEGFEPLPINHSATFGTIKVLFETNLKEVKEKIKKAKEAEAADTADATDATDTEKAKQPETKPETKTPKQPETKQEQPETKTPEVEAIERAFERKKAKAEEIKAIAEAKAIAIKKEKAIAEAKVEEAKAKAEELAQSAQDARNLVLQKRQEATNTFKGMSNMKALQGYAEQLATAKVAKAKQSTDRMNNLLTS